MRSMTAFSSLVLVLPGVAFGQNDFDPTTAQRGSAGVGKSPTTLTVSSFDKRALELYGTDVNLGNLLSVDKFNGNTTLVGAMTSSTVAGLAWDPSTSTCYGTDTLSGDLVTVDLATGATTIVGNTGILLPHGLALDPVTGVLYCMNGWTGDLYTLNKLTGAPTLVGASGYLNINGLDFDPTTGTLYGSYAYQNATGYLITIDTATGAGTFVANTHRINGLAFDQNGDLYGADNSIISGVDSKLYSIDKSTGAWSQIGVMTGIDNMLGLVFNTDPVASATFRNAGVNPASHTAVTRPAIGSTYTATVDLAGTTGHNMAWLLGFATPTTDTLGGGQVLLMDLMALGGELLLQPFQSGPVATYNMAIPADLVFVGVSAATQAVHFGGVKPFALSNAQDLFVAF